MPDAASPTAGSLPLPPAPRPRRWWGTWLLGGLLFLSGVVIGAGGAAIVIRQVVLTMIRSPEKAPERITARLTSTLSLDTEQAKTVRTIVTRHQRNILSLRRQVQPEFEAELAAAYQEIHAVLRPDQQATWAAHYTRLRETWIPPLPPENPREQESAEKTKH